MSENKKIRYVKIRDEDMNYNPPEKTAAKKKHRKKPHELTTGQKVRHVFAVIGTTLLSLLLIVIITGCIVATSLTIYVMQFAESSFDVDLRDVELSFSSFLKGYDDEGNEVLIKQLNTDENRIWVDIDDIPQNVIDAVVSVEDKRFFDHEGVDWTRMFGVVYYTMFSGGTDGGSTISMQLVRNVTGDDKANVGRKLREIFRALALEQKYTKLDILESYLNRIAFGGTTYGIGSAAYQYFGKEVSELDTAEAAILAGLIRSPTNYNPYTDLQQSKTRQLYALLCMYEQGNITTAEYEAAKVEQVKFRRPVLGDSYGYVDERYNEWYGIQDETTSEDDLYYSDEDWEDVRDDVPYQWNGTYQVTQDWYDDACINQVVTDLADKLDVSETTAREKLYKGGYTIYSNKDFRIQNIVSEKFSDPYTVLSKYDVNAASEDTLQAAFIIMDYRGRVLACAGGLGEKPGDNCFNRATQSVRAIGSTVKPVSVYSTAIDNNVITYSTMLQDISGEIDNPENPNDPAERLRWPHNYQETGYGSGLYMPAWYAVQKSVNTIAVRVLSLVGLRTAYTQLTERLGISTLDPVNDLAWSPLGTGAFTRGVKLVELAAAYQIMGNGGVYYEPYFYSKVVDSNGTVVLEQDSLGIQAIEKDSAWITNRMMYTVVHDFTGGTGPNAIIKNAAGEETVEVVGKTGTANDMSNLLFAGLTPEYVGLYRIGYDDNREVGKGDGWIAVARAWYNVMSAVVDCETEQKFTPDSDVIVANYCTETGLLATSKCPSTQVGYYRKSNIPASCDSDHKGGYWKEHGMGEIPYYGVERG